MSRTFKDEREKTPESESERLDNALVKVRDITSTRVFVDAMRGLSKEDPNRAEHLATLESYADFFDQLSKDLREVVDKNK